MMERDGKGEGMGGDGARLLIFPLAGLASTDLKPFFVDRCT